MMRQRAYLKRKEDRLIEKTADSKQKKILQYSTVIIALLSWLLYLLGRVYHQTYLAYWGLSESLFPLSKEESVIGGFFRYLVYGANLLPWMNVLLWGVVAVMIVVFISCYRPVAEYWYKVFSGMRHRIGPTLRNSVVITEAHERVMDTVMMTTGGIIFLVLLPFVFMLSCLEMVNQAKDAAQKEHKRILSGVANENPFGSRPVLYIRNESKGFDIYSGHAIATSTTHCALYNNSQGVIVFPLSSVARMVINEHRTTPSK